jgi:hypothetical protein
VVLLQFPRAPHERFFCGLWRLKEKNFRWGERKKKKEKRKKKKEKRKKKKEKRKKKKKKEKEKEKKRKKKNQKEKKKKEKRKTNEHKTQKGAIVRDLARYISTGQCVPRYTIYDETKSFVGRLASWSVGLGPRRRSHAQEPAK